MSAEGTAWQSFAVLPPSKRGVEVFLVMVGNSFCYCTAEMDFLSSRSTLLLLAYVEAEQGKRFTTVNAGPIPPQNALVWLGEKP